MGPVFSEEHSRVLLSEPWSTKIDGATSTCYFYKFHASPLDGSCCFMITDTKNVWTEVLSSKGIARRRREISVDESDPPSTDNELAQLSQIHAFKNMIDVDFTVEPSKLADLTVNITMNEMEWRWETESMGRMTATLLSEHLIIPLICVTNLAFSSADPLKDLPGPDLEKIVDKGRILLSKDPSQYVKQAISRPRMTTTMQRMTAMLHHLPQLPPIVAEVEDLQFMPLPPVPISKPIPSKQELPPPAPIHVPQQASSRTKLAETPLSPKVPAARSPRVDDSVGVVTLSPTRRRRPRAPQSVEREEVTQPTARSPTPSSPIKLDSATETEEEGDTSLMVVKEPAKRKSTSDSDERLPPKSTSAAPAEDDSDDSPAPKVPAKKVKKKVSSSSDDDDSESQSKAKASKGRGTGVKQPMKRTRRF